MTKKHSKMYDVTIKQAESSLVIDMNTINRKKAYHPICFKTGKHMSEKDRPRRKNWLREANL